MNRGCVAVGEIRCDNCQRLIEAGHRYLLLEEKEGEKSCFCVECSVAKGYAVYVKDKWEEVLTFFPVNIDSGS